MNALRCLRATMIAAPELVSNELAVSRSQRASSRRLVCIPKLRSQLRSNPMKTTVHSGDFI